MHEDQKRTEDQLRLATSRSLPAETQLDSDTAASREAFLALGASVESAARNLDTAALLARLQKSCLETTVIHQPSRKPRPDWFSLAIAGALAAAALVAIARIVVESSAVGPQVAQQMKSAIEGVGTLPYESPLPPVPAWNDALDDEIALASATLGQFTGHSHGFDASLLDMNDQLKALSHELSNETL